MPCGTDLCTAWHSCCSVQPCKDSFVDLLISSCKLPEDPVQRVNGEQLTFLQLYPLHSRWVCTCVNMPTQFLPVLMATYSGAWPTLWCWMQTLACVHQWSDALNHTTGPLSSVWLPGRTQQATCGHMWTHLCTAGHRAVLCAWALASSCKPQLHVLDCPPPPQSTRTCVHAQCGFQPLPDGPCMQPALQLPAPALYCPCWPTYLLCSSCQPQQLLVGFLHCYFTAPHSGWA
jgi:hypothetical protein